MKFTVRYLSKIGGRIGILNNLKSHKDEAYTTPLCLVTTRGGSVPHLLKDSLHLCVPENALLCIPVQHFVNMLDVLQEYRKGVTHFSALGTHTSCSVVHDPSSYSKSGYNNKNWVSLFIKEDKHILCPEKYIQLVEEVRPDWFEALCDADTNENSSAKRTQKSLANSLNFLQSCQQLHLQSEELKDVPLFVPLLGGHEPKQRQKWAMEVEKMANIGGYSLLGVHSNGETAEGVSPDALKFIMEITIPCIPSIKKKPLQALGAYTPLAVLQLCITGVDIFDTSLPLVVAERGAALVFPTSPNYVTDEEFLNRIHQDDSKAEDSFVNDSTSHDSSKKRRPSRSTHDSQNCDDAYTVKYYERNLRNKLSCHSDAGAILPHCKCYTCSNFTVSYIHHLLSVREMLAPVLLTIHNLHHWLEFFEGIRCSIEEDNLQQFVGLMQQFMDTVQDLNKKRLKTEVDIKD